MRDGQNVNSRFCASCVRVLLREMKKVSCQPADLNASLTYHFGVIDQDRDRGVDDGNENAGG